MCGIVGFWNTSKPVEPCIFDSMVDSLSHRGPDGRGVKIFDNGWLFLGHRRLSIIDLSDAGQQPMSNEDGTVWLTFNGEIFNFENLRRELVKCGHQFHSRTDSETIIHAYEEWGTECVHRLRGIFAFAIYDSHHKSLFIARDHVGVKPLYYFHDQYTFAFASQPRAILASKAFRKQIDNKAFSLFLAYGNTPGDSCIFEGIHKLLPGHWLTYKNGQLNIQRYWSATYRPAIRDSREAEQAVCSKIEECVSLQTISDVPIGTLLSGGIDSTIITSILSKRIGYDVSSYTIGFEEKESDEREYARYIANIYHTEQHEKILTYSDACTTLPEIIEAFDEPFHLNGLFPFYALSRLVALSGRKVVLGGDGADELFAGYLWYEQFNIAQPLNVFTSVLNRVFPCIGKNILQTHTLPVETYFNYNGYLDYEYQQAILGENICISPSELLLPLTKHWRADLPPVLAAQLLDFNCFMVDHCLTKVDRSSMACGVEVRVPFLDVELVDLVFSIDHKITYFTEERKALLKKAMQLHLPLGMDRGRKKGFSSPLDMWFSGGIANAGENLLFGGCLCDRGILNEDKLRRIYSNLHAGQKLLLIGAELWVRRWLEDDMDAIHCFSGQCIRSNVKLNV